MAISKVGASKVIESGLRIATNESPVKAAAAVQKVRNERSHFNEYLTPNNVAKEVQVVEEIKLRPRDKGYLFDAKA